MSKKQKKSTFFSISMVTKRAYPLRARFCAGRALCEGSEPGISWLSNTNLNGGTFRLRGLVYTHS